MPTQVVSRWRAALDKRLLTDALRANDLAKVLKMSATSPLGQAPAIAASIAALTTKGATLATSVTGVSTTLKQLKAVTAQRSLARSAFDLELEALKSLVENAATSGGDITGMGFTLLTVNKASRTVPDAPAALVVRIGKAHGRARVTVAGPNNGGAYVAEASPDPIGPATWAPLPGTRKSRQLTGYATGTKVWVRFAAVRFGLQSDWSTPVLVTIP
jgi:hypothetical protein